MFSKSVLVGVPAIVVGVSVLSFFMRNMVKKSDVAAWLLVAVGIVGMLVIASL